MGETPALSDWAQPVPGIRAMGRGPHARTRVNRFGFPVEYLSSQKSVRRFRTGDIVRASGSFNARAAGGTVQGVPLRHCRIIQRGDGYGCHLDTSSRQGETATMHETRDPAFLPALKDGVSCGVNR